jgi:hypothetical protein
MFPKLLEEEALTSRLIVAQCMPWSVEGRQIHAGCVDANGLPLAGGKLEAERNMALPLSFDREAAGRSGGIIARCNAPNAGCSRLHARWPASNMPPQSICFIRWQAARF